MVGISRDCRPFGFIEFRIYDFFSGYEILRVDLTALSLYLKGLAEEITNRKVDRIVVAGMNILIAKNGFFGVYRLFFIKTKLLSDIL